MDTNTLVNMIQTVTKTLNQEGFEHVSISHEGTTLTLNKQSMTGGYAPAPVAVSAPQQAVPSSASTPLTAAPPQEAPVQQSEAPAAAASVSGAFKTIDSPIVGTFYDSPSPEAEAYVKVGDKVKKGDIVCIIEAMKLMNEIEAECDGEIVEICVRNEGPVEYGQTLYKLK